MVNILSNCYKKWFDFDSLKFQKQVKIDTLPDKVKTTLAKLGHPFPEKILILEKKITILLTKSPRLASFALIAAVPLITVCMVALAVSVVSFCTFQWHITPWSIGICCLTFYLSKLSVKYCSDYTKALPSKKEVEELTQFHTWRQSISKWNEAISVVKTTLAPEQQTDIETAQLFFNLKMQNFERLANLLEAKAKALT